MAKATASQVIAVTGPMAAGKNYICKKLENEGWSAIDADLLVHEAIELAKDRILETFEPLAKEENFQIQNKDGSINRKALGSLLFSNPELLRTQESIVYPIITSKIEELFHFIVLISRSTVFFVSRIIRRAHFRPTPRTFFDYKWIIILRSARF